MADDDPIRAVMRILVREEVERALAATRPAAGLVTIAAYAARRSISEES